MKWAPWAGIALMSAAAPISAPAQAPEAISISLAEAVELALAQDYALRQSRLDQRTAEAQVDEVWGSVYPSVNLSAGYSRNFEAANPFAGSNAGGLFGGLAALDWLAFNEGPAPTMIRPRTPSASGSSTSARRRAGRRRASRTTAGATRSSCPTSSTPPSP